MARKLICLTIVIATSMTFFGGYLTAQPYTPADYFPLAVGNHWTYYDSTRNWWSGIDVVDDTTFGIPGEILSYKTEFSEWAVGYDTSIYRTTYFSYDENGGLGHAAHLMDDSVYVYDSLWIYLQNPIVIGDSIYYSAFGQEGVIVVVSVTETLNLPLGQYDNCLHTYEYSTIDGQLNYKEDAYYIPMAYWPIA
ncbi:MAG: hypothetical protein ABH878_10160, partial [bacterium]